MRFLGIGDVNDLGDMYVRLLAAGHEVKVYVGDPDSADTLEGLVPRTPDWRAELDWVRQAGEDGILLFENASDGAIQDELRADGLNVIGGSALGDRLEQDREFGQVCLSDAGLAIAKSTRFTDFPAGIAFVRSHPGRYVFKLDGSAFHASRNYVGELDDGRDICALLEKEHAQWKEKTRPSFILMEHLSGVEVGVGAYFNGEDFLEPVCIDWEHKRFFPGDIGELTGEMGTLVSYGNAQPLFARTLAKMKDILRSSGYVGYINLNTIVNERGIWPLEFTCRFGYPGFAILSALHLEGWDVLFSRMIRRTRTDFRTRPGFAVGVAITVPPFPSAHDYARKSKGLPVLFRRPLTTDDWTHIHLDEVALRDGQLYASGQVGHLMVVTGCGETVEDARTGAYDLARQIVVPNLRYRNDIGLRFIERDRSLLAEAGLWPKA